MCEGDIYDREEAILHPRDRLSKKHRKAETLTNLCNTTTTLLLIIAAALTVTPTKASTLTEFVQVGNASWYGGRHAGRITANQEIFNSRAATCAHRTLPFNSLVRVTIPSTGASAVCRVNDRGPYPVLLRHDRSKRLAIIDVTETMAKHLGFHDGGLAPVRIEKLQSDASVEVAEAFDVPPVKASRLAYMTPQRPPMAFHHHHHRRHH